MRVRAPFPVITSFDVHPTMSIITSSYIKSCVLVSRDAYTYLNSSAIYWTNRKIYLFSLPCVYRI